MKQMLLLTIDYPPMRGGVARYLSVLKDFFGDHMTVVAPPDTQLLFTYFWPRWLRAFVPLWTHRQSYDVLVVSHVIPLGTVAWIQKVFLRKPYVIILHGMDFALTQRSLWKRWLTARILRSATRVVVNTNSLREQVSSVISKVEIQVCYPPLSTTFLQTSQAPISHQADVFTLLTVARLVPRKGHARVLEALATMREQGMLSPCRYLIVGDGPQFRSLQEQVKVLGLQDMVVFIRQATDVQLARYYAQADVLVMPTDALGGDREGFGLCYIEAAVFGVPSIASNVPGVNEAILHEETGLLIPCGSVMDLMIALHRLMTDDELRLRLGEQARERAVTLFTAERQFSHWQNFL